MPRSVNNTVKKNQQDVIGGERQMQMLEMPGFPVSVAAKYIGVRRETVYQWIHLGKVNARLNAVNQYELPYEELYRILKDKESRGR